MGSELVSCMAGFIAAIFNEICASAQKHTSLAVEEIVQMVLNTMIGTGQLMIENNYSYQYRINYYRNNNNRNNTNNYNRYNNYSNNRNYHNNDYNYKNQRSSNYNENRRYNNNEYYNGNRRNNYYNNNNRYY